jgi:hypothetical protein
MSDIDPKTKMISLRISGAEYAVLKSQYRTHGARNISDLARLALQQIMHGSVMPKDAIAQKLEAMEDRIRALESEVFPLSERDAS